MNKQEAIEKLKKQLTLNSEIVGSEFDKGYNYAIKIAIATVVKLDEPEKAVLSKEEAEWLERLKKAKSFLNCLYIITRQGWGHDFEFYVHEEKHKLSYRDDNDEDSEQTKNRLVNALIYGYEVEKEKLYTVELPNPNYQDSGSFVLCKDKKGKAFLDWHYSEILKELDGIKLTEAEIKEDFEWAWQFAEEVKE